MKTMFITEHKRKAQIRYVNKIPTDRALTAMLLYLNSYRCPLQYHCVFHINCILKRVAEKALHGTAGQIAQHQTQCCNEIICAHFDIM